MSAPTTTRRRREAGEPLVWLTAAGLSLGTLMVLAVLGVIVVHGLGSFWPRRAESFVIATAGGAEERVTGVVVQSRQAGDGRDEVQLWIGNREVNGLSFRWVDRSAIRATSLDDGVLQVEREQDGPALGRPLAVVLDGVTTPVGQPGFEAALADLQRVAGGRRAEIREIEKERIGRNAAQIERLRRQGDAQGRLPALEAEFNELAAQARALRQRNHDDRLLLALDHGRELTVPAGDLREAWWPNRPGVVGRSGRLLANLWAFVSEEPRDSNTAGGIFPAIFGTVVMTVLMSLAVVPVGVLAAIYLREYARQGPLVRTVRIAINNLAGVPSIVFGVFGLGFFVYFIGGGLDRLLFADRLPTPTFGTGGILWAALTLALMTVPVVIVATEEAISAVPRGMREGSLACGASKWQTIQRIVLPASVPGILTGAILAMARGAGEVAPLMLVGVVKLAPSLPLDLTWPFVHLDQKFMHLGFHIYDLGFQSPDSEAARPMVYATTLFLILLVLLLNLGAILLRERIRRRTATGAF